MYIRMYWYYGDKSMNLFGYYVTVLGGWVQG